MKKILYIYIAIFLIITGSAWAVVIGYFPGIQKLINKADAIVILRIDSHIKYRRFLDEVYTTHSCYIYQSLKGDIPINKRIKLDLLNTRAKFVPPFDLGSTHLMFLTKKRSKDEPTDYRTIEYIGANIILSPFNHEKIPKGKTIKDKIKNLIKKSIKYKKQEMDKELAFLNSLL